MNTDKFTGMVDVVLDELKSPENKKAFIENMNHLGMGDKKFSEWMMMYLAWNELGSEKDCSAYYWNLNEE